MAAHMYMCRRCGYQTASFVFLGSCPNCQTTGKKFVVVLGIHDDGEVQKWNSAANERRMTTKTMGFFKRTRILRSLFR